MEEIIYLVIITAIFILITIPVKIIHKTLKKKSNHKVLNQEEYLPKEEIQSLKQVFYLIMMTLFLIDIFYQISFVKNNLIYFELYDILLCLFTISIIKLNNKKAWILSILLIPIDSLEFVFIGIQPIWIIILGLFHLIGLFYVIIYFYKKFIEYTKSNELSYTILLLFVIIFLSFIWTSYVEQVNLLDSLVMVSNAFTSNGYSILGHTIPGKINEIFLVWSGYVLSGVGTATLTTALLTKHYDKKFDKLTELIEELKEEIEKK